MKRATLANNKITLPSGVEIAYYSIGSSGESGTDGRSAAVFLHGFCGSSAYWAEVLPLLAGQGRVIVPDLRGHGESSAPTDEVYTMESFADDLEALLQSLGIETILLFGHSLGGYITAAFAERYPHRLKGLSLVHSTAQADGDEAKANRDKAAANIASDGLEPFVEGLIPKLFAPDHLKTMADTVESIKAIGRSGSAHGAAATARGMKERPDRTAVLSQSGLRVLLIAGEKDGIIPPDKTFSVDGPSVSRVLVEKAGHMSMVEAPKALAGAIADFIGGCKEA
jgi:3-oxoadipate enol-lactonase